MNKIICKHCFITGRVQGVAFRYYTHNQAQRLGVFGWVRNLPDGRVEAFIYGDSTPVMQLCNWLHQGPPTANVIQVDCETKSPPSTSTQIFEIR